MRGILILIAIGSLLWAFLSFNIYAVVLFVVAMIGIVIWESDDDEEIGG